MGVHPLTGLKIQQASHVSKVSIRITGFLLFFMEVI
jgi:hypothetical protein